MYPYARRCECGTVGEQRSVSEFHCPTCTKAAQELPPDASLPPGATLGRGVFTMRARLRAKRDPSKTRKGHGPQ